MTMVMDSAVATSTRSPGLTTERKLIALRQRLVDAQRDLIMQAAEANAVPSALALRKIADLESAIVATETMIEEERSNR